MDSFSLAKAESVRISTIQALRCGSKSGRRCPDYVLLGEMGMLRRIVLKGKAGKEWRYSETEFHKKLSPGRGGIRWGRNSR